MRGDPTGGAARDDARGGSTERRRHPRFPASEEALVLGAQRPARMVDVSLGGIGIRYPGTEPLGEEVRIDLLDPLSSLVLEGVRCRKVSEVTEGRTLVFSYVADRRIGLQFIDPDPSLLGSLRHFARGGEWGS